MTSKDRIFLVTTPESDDVLYYCSTWTEEIIDEAKKKGFSVAVLPKEKANQKNFEGHVVKQRPDFVMFNGHGTKELIRGHEKEVLLKKDRNNELMKDKVIYARSCYALAELGQSCVEAGTKAFVGYALPFSFVSDPKETAHPLRDKLAAPCFVTSNIVPISIIKGRSVSEAVEKAKIKTDELLSYWETRSDVVEAPFVATCLYWNKTALGYKGDGSTTL